MDGPEAGAVARSHVLVERLDGVRTAELTELLVHVVRAGARVVTNPDTEVLHLERLLFMDLRFISIPSACLLRAAWANGSNIKIRTTLTPMISPVAFLTFLSCLCSFVNTLS